MYWFKHGRDVCIGSNTGEMCVLAHEMYICIGSNMGKIYVLIQTCEIGRDVCIGSNMGEMYVLVQTWERCMYWFKHSEMYVLTFLH